MLKDLHPSQKVYAYVQDFAWHMGTLYVRRDALTHKIPPRGEAWQIINDHEGIFVVASSMNAAQLTRIPSLDFAGSDWYKVARVV